MTPSHKIMIADGAPKALFLTPEARKKAWQGVALRSVPFAQIKVTRDESPETAAFRAQVEEERRLKSLAQIGKMKARFKAKANPVDYSKTRWDPRRSKFVPDTGSKPNVSTPDQGLPRPEHASKQVKPAAKVPAPAAPNVARTYVDATGNWSRITKDTAEAIAKLNGVWKPDYEKLRGTGRIVMTVGNVLKGHAKRGEAVKWPK